MVPRVEVSWAEEGPCQDYGWVGLWHPGSLMASGEASGQERSDTWSRVALCD